MIDNVALIESYLRLYDPDTFYFLQIIKRRKDNPEMNGDNRVIKNYFIDGFNPLEKYRDEIIDICTKNNARAYIRLNSRSYNKVAAHAISSMFDYFQQEQYKICRKSYDHACGVTHNKDRMTWLFDFDGTPLHSPLNQGIIHAILSCSTIELTIPTKNGFHLMVKPFNMNLLKLTTEELGRFVVHKDNPTILYIP
jgi:hypothetical protein